MKGIHIMIRDNLKVVESNIENACKKAGRNTEDVTLICVSKTKPTSMIYEAMDCGYTAFGENKVQELCNKYEEINNPDLQWHLIGHLQTNKVKYLVGKVELIHSVDSLHLAEQIDRVAKKKNVIQDVLIEINVGCELSKGGISIEETPLIIKNISENFKNLRVKGLMTMFPHVDDNELIEELCVKMRNLYDNLKGQGYEFEYLSMGMSNDYEIAIKNGSNLIRLGRTIFGQRNYGENKNGII